MLDLTSSSAVPPCAPTDPEGLFAVELVIYVALYCTTAQVCMCKRVIVLLNGIGRDPRWRRVVHGRRFLCCPDCIQNPAAPAQIQVHRHTDNPLPVGLWHPLGRHGQVYLAAPLFSFPLPPFFASERVARSAPLRETIVTLPASGPLAKLLRRRHLRRIFRASCTYYSMYVFSSYLYVQKKKKRSSLLRNLFKRRATIHAFRALSIPRRWLMPRPPPSLTA